MIYVVFCGITETGRPPHGNGVLCCVRVRERRLKPIPNENILLIIIIITLHNVEHVYALMRERY